MGTHVKANLVPDNIITLNPYITRIKPFPKPSKDPYRSLLKPIGSL